MSAPQPSPLRSGILLSVEDLHKHFKAGRGFAKGQKQVLRAVDGVDLAIHRKELVGLVGESGCGKTTLGFCIAGILAPTSGAVVYEGKALHTLSGRSLRAVRPQIQMIFQDPRGSLDPRMTVGASLAEPYQIAGTLSRSERDQEVLRLLSSVNLPETYAGRFPHELSGGELQRVAIARATSLRPSVVVADEPVSALDPSIRSQVMGLLLSLADTLSMSVLLIIHDLPLATKTCHRVAVMYLGKIMEVGPSGRLSANPKHPYTKALIAASRSYEEGLTMIHGEPESPIDLPSGCRFRRRCPLAFDKCREIAPDLQPADADTQHSAACHLP